MEQLFKILPRTFPLFCPTYRLPGHRTWLVKEIKYFYVFIFLSLDACGKPPVFESMKFKGVPKSSYSPGEKIYFEWYKPVVPPLTTSTVCQPDNTWAPFQEVCTRKLCPQLGEPQNGQIIYINGTFEFGPQAYYVCNEGLAGAIMLAKSHSWKSLFLILLQKSEEVKNRY
uniref:Sushi domain-containing protein n=1 Tax=Rhinolophus ferrumequinum TaxID=59479 RepID=A0A671FS16_RHIFE